MHFLHLLSEQASDKDVVRAGGRVYIHSLPLTWILGDAGSTIITASTPGLLRLGYTTALDVHDHLRSITTFNASQADIDGRGTGERGRCRAGREDIS